MTSATQQHEITETESLILWGFFGFTALMTSIILSIACHNIYNMYKLGMKRTLIILLYITCISRELLSAAMIFVYAYYHRIDLALEYPLSRWLTSVFDFMDIGLIVTVILTNLQLATSMQSIRGFTTEE